MRPRTYRVDGHEIKFSVEGDTISTVFDGKTSTDNNIRAVAVSIGGAVESWIIRSILNEAAQEGWDPIWGVKKEESE